jgi:hypothetical protein
MLQIAFSGSREGMTPEQLVTLHRLLENYSSKTTIQDFHHGMSGKSDLLAHYAARTYNFYYIIGHPCDIEKWRIAVTVDELRQIKPPLVRNQDMIDEIGSETGLLIATPKTDSFSRSGTYGTLQRAHNSGVKYEIIQRDGSLRYEI